MLNSLTSWYLLYTKPKHEHKIASQLSLKEIHYFLPELKISKIWHDRKKLITTPLFPSYIFVDLTAAADYVSTLECSGALYFIKFGNQLAKINDQIISSLDYLVNSQSSLEVTSQNFSAGQELYIQSGALQGHKCEVVKLKNKEMILVRVNILNRSVLAEFPVENVCSSV